jgi:hypothetical protein
MRGEGRRIYPEKGAVLFDGGLNTKFEKSIIEDNESPDCANVVFTNGAVETRQGAIKVNTTSVGSFVGDGIYTRRGNDLAETMIVWAGGYMWQLAGSTFTTVPSATSVFTAGVRMGAVMQEDYMFFGNGNVIPYKWNGSEFTRHGVYPPTTTMTVASNGAGLLTASGEYRYGVTFRNSNLVESDLSPLTATFVVSATSGQLRLTSIPVAPTSFGVNTRRLYRTSGTAGSTTFKLLTTLGDNTTTTYDDNIPDTALGAVAPSDNGVPPKYRVAIYLSNRLFVIDADNQNLVKYSNLNDPYTFASTNFIRVGDNTSDLAQALGILDGSLIIACEKSDTIVYMPSTDPSEWKQELARTTLGSKSPFGVANYLNKMFFPAVENGKFVGFAALAGSTVEPSASILSVSTAGSELRSDRIEPDMFNIQESMLGNISATVYRNRIYVTVPYGSGATANNRIYVLDYSMSNLRKNQKESWVPWTGLNATQFTVYNGSLYYVSSTATGFVYRLEGGTYSDDGAAIDSYYWTKEYPGYSNEINFNKDHRYLKMLVDQAGNYFMGFAYRVDSDKGTGTLKQVSLNPGSSLWGTMRWGLDMWGGGKNQDEKLVYLDGARGTRIQFKFTNQNTANQRFKVHRLNYAYNLKGYR